MRADEQIRVAVGRGADGLSALRRGREAREEPYGDGERCKPFAKRPLVLGRKHGGRGQHRHLFAREYRRSRGADRDFRFSEPHIACQHSVHRAFCCQVIHNLFFGPALAFGLLIAE